MWHVPGQLIDTTFVKVPRSHNSREANKRMQSYAVSDTAVDDSQVFEPLLDESEDAEGKKRAVYADSAYRCNELEQTLGANGFDSQIHETGMRDHPLQEEQKVANRVKSQTRVRGEPVFGAHHAMGGHIVRVTAYFAAFLK